MLASGCSLWLPWRSEPSEEPAGDRFQEWVVITFTGTDEFPADAMDALLATELAADEALSAAGAGMIDGNEIGDGMYQLFFVGVDRHRMWGLLEPVFADAPIPWSRVELFTSLEGESEVVLPR